MTPEAFAEHLASQPTWRLHRAPVEFGDHPAAVPDEAVWVWWWAPVLGPAPVITVWYLHHLITAGHDQVELERLAVALGLGTSWAAITAEHPLVEALTVAASHRLLAAGQHNSLVLYVPIPRPGLGRAKVDRAIQKGIQP